MEPLKIRIQEQKGIARRLEPIRFGIPLQKGELKDPTRLVLLAGKRRFPIQSSTLLRWDDQSVRWLLVESLVSLRAEELLELTLEEAHSEDEPPSPTYELVSASGPDELFQLNDAQGRPVGRFKLSCELQGKISMTVGQPTVVADGALFARMRREVSLLLHSEKTVRCAIEVTHYKENALFHFELVLWNPSAAKHLGGIWDLGDEGSVGVEELTLRFEPESAQLSEVAWTTECGGQLRSHSGPELEIYQESSGGERWRSENHCNRIGVVPLRFRGYKVSAGKTLEQGLRAEPIVVGNFGTQIIGASLPRFWQKFPNALRVSSAGIEASIFPAQSPGPIELQGGEKRSGEAYFSFAGTPEALTSLSALYSPLSVTLPTEIYEKFGLILTPAGDEDARLRELTHLALEGPRNFFKKREAIDEYGWRNFGCVFADHESVHHPEDAPCVSHYNNQYDLAYGFALQFLRGGDSRWFELFTDLARHTYDIDIYWTTEDRPAYSGGYFWHTEHYLPANRATHRCYSAMNNGTRPKAHCGGGPASEHNYTSGLTLFYLMTGDARAREAVLRLADWVIEMDRGEKSALSILDSGPTGLASQTRSASFHGPGRGAGNSINALLDAHLLTGQARYLNAAEELIARVIHPRDDIAKFGLPHAETRWSYLIFLQVLVKYLHFKKENPDSKFEYARASLLHYARWMLKNERPFSEQRSAIEIWTESWPAHDMRKADVFDGAAYFAPPSERELFRKEAARYYDSSLTELWSYETKDFARPLATIFYSALSHEERERRAESYEKSEYSEHPWKRRPIFRRKRERILQKGLMLAGGLMSILGFYLFLNTQAPGRNSLLPGQFLSSSVSAAGTFE